jgi:hypothetical protein
MCNNCSAWLAALICRVRRAGPPLPSPPSATVVLFLRIVRSDGQPAESAGLLFAGAAGGQADSLAAAAPDAEAGTAPVRRQHRPGALQCGRYRSVLSDMRCAVSAPYLMRGVCRGERASNCLLFSVHRLVCALWRPIEGQSPQALRRIATASERTRPRPVRTPAARSPLRLLVDGCGEVTLLEPSAADVADVRELEGSLVRGGDGPPRDRGRRRGSSSA